MGSRRGEHTSSSTSVTCSDREESTTGPLVLAMPLSLWNKSLSDIQQARDSRYRYSSLSTSLVYLSRTIFTPSHRSWLWRRTVIHLRLPGRTPITQTSTITVHMVDHPSSLSNPLRNIHRRLPISCRYLLSLVQAQILRESLQSPNPGVTTLHP